MTSLQKLWNVAILTLYASVFSCVSSLFLMFVAALSVNVRQSMFSGFVSVFCRMFMILWLIICVLPVPGPATTSTGPSMVSTASLWAEFNFSKSPCIFVNLW